jgi:thioredoxin 1
MTIQITDNNFDATIANGVVVVDFWAEWCKPCEIMGSVFEKISNQITGVIFGKMDIDNNPATPRRFGIRSIPTLLVFKDGEIIGSATGAKTEAQLNAWINDMIS